MNGENDKHTVNSRFFLEIAEAAVNSIQYLKDLGIPGFDCSSGNMKLMKSWGDPRNKMPDDFDAVLSDANACNQCRLYERRKNPVVGEGNQEAGLMFVGDVPGRVDDDLGQPFSGLAGELLSKIITAIQHTRENVYLCNVIKCRPPVNRKPFPEEIEACLPFLERQISLIKPDFICTLGPLASQTLLDIKNPVRGQLYDYNGIKVMPTYHPADLIEHPEKKRDVWEDMKKLMKEMGFNIHK